MPGYLPFQRLQSWSWPPQNDSHDSHVSDSPCSSSSNQTWKLSWLAGWSPKESLPLITVWWLTPPSVQKQPSKSVVTGSSLKSRQPSTHLFPLISKIPNLEKDVPLSHHLKNKLPSPKLLSQMLMSPFLIKSNDLGIYFFPFIRFWHLWFVQEMILWL